MITAAYTPTYRDTVRATRAVNKTLPLPRFIRRAALWLGVLALVLTLGGAGIAWVVTLFSVVVTVLFILWALPWQWAWIVRRKNPAMRAEQRFTFSPAGVEATAPGATARLQWQAIIRIEATKDFLILFTSDRAGHAVPIRALSEPAAIDTIRAWHRAPPAAAADDAGEPPRSLEPAIFAVSFQHQFRETRRAMIAAARHGPARWPYFVAMAALGWFAGGAAAYDRWRESSWQSVDWLQLAFAFLPLALLFAIPPLGALWATYRFHRSNPSAAGTQTIRMDTSGIDVSSPVHGGHVDWNSMLKVVETADFILFFVTQVHAHVLPKRLLDRDALRTARATLRQKLGAKAKLSF